MEICDVFCFQGLLVCKSQASDSPLLNLDLGKVHASCGILEVIASKATFLDFKSELDHMASQF